MTRKRLIEVTPTWATGGGIFAALANEAQRRSTTLPWTADGTDLDTYYYGEYSGDKYISPLLAKMLGSDEEITVQNAAIAKIAYSMHAEDWQRKWDAYFSEYDPIENYDSEEYETYTKSNTGTQGNAKTGTETETTTPTDWKTTKEQKTADNEQKTTSKIYGYDSSSGSDSDETTTTTKSKQEETQSGELENETSYNTTETRTDNLQEHNERIFSRHGNIGVTTSQQMIQSELELRTMGYFYMIFQDLDKFLTIAVY